MNTISAAELEQEIDAGNYYIAHSWREFNRDVDMFFSNQHYKIADNKSSIRAFSTFYKKEGEKFQSQYEFQLKIDLPRTAKKLQITVEKEQDEVTRAITDDTLSNKNNPARVSENGYTAGMRAVLSQNKYFSSFFHFGIRLDLPLNPFVKVDLQKAMELTYFNIGLSQKIFLYRQEGLQEISQATLNKLWNETISSDFIHSLIWTDQTNTFVLRNNFILYQKLDQDKLLSYSIGANAKFIPTWYYDSYDTSVNYRLLLYHKWLYATFTVGADFIKDHKFKREDFAQVRLEVFFND